MWSVNLPVALSGVGQLLDSTHGRVLRYSLLETTGTTAATILIYDGSGAGGILLDAISLAPGQSTRERFEHWEYPYDAGLYLSVTGSIKGGFTVGHSDDWDRDGRPVVLVNPQVLSLTVDTHQ